MCFIALPEELYGGLVRGVFVSVVECREWYKGRRLRIACVGAPLEGACKQPVRKVGVLGERGSVQVRADQVAVYAALKSVIAVVARARHHGSSQGRLVGIELGASAMVLKAHEFVGEQVAGDRHVAGEAAFAAHGFRTDDP